MEIGSASPSFLQVPRPSTKIILTAPRISDGPEVIAIQNAPSVYMNLLGLPFPYTPADWDSWFPIYSKAVKLLKNGRQRAVRETQGYKSKGIPFPGIREDDKKTGDETFLGEISIRRSGFIMKMDQDEKEDERCEWCA
ncbi:hypothetical protein DL95DRAFT_494930 [Leptodontidium sp. 2 PMI_412]|nr:hypothetical protein DL95DRAFT_494930 [Leptodontidium sp. 2 PMI_412]